MKTQVEITHDDHMYADWVQGERGYIDGYCRGGDNAPYAMVVITNPAIKYNKRRIVMVKPSSLNIINPAQ